MAIATKQLESIFKEISERFAKNRSISVQAAEGDPPEKYEVTYNLKGLHLNKNQEIVEASQHTIAITIPFGFPHFPPNCKPISSIFHPDFDQAAICIGDFWKKDSTLSGLIVHIGRMIAGQIYSTDNAFNEDAVIWYKQHSDRLPFESQDFSGKDEQLPAPSPRMDSFSELETMEIDSLEEPVLDTDFSPHDFETQGTPFGQQPVPPTPADDIDMHMLQLMAKQKRFFALSDRVDHRVECEQG